ncbi:DurN family substrate-assisted peptide maturase [Saccharopolyspora taberi]|uniref:Uncharacterized protein n=1 Tax=Saccharopolyspora taberi TaxID=60895 RepID=A0ABN3VGL1_9PSEU
MKSAKEPTIYPGVEEIRRIQHLAVVCALLPPDGKLRELLELALKVHEEPLLARLTPITDQHPFATKTWLESLWLREGASAEEKELVAWQNTSENMNAAIQELRNIEKQLGVKIGAE